MQVSVQGVCVLLFGKVGHVNIQRIEVPPSPPLNTGTKERIGIYKHKGTLWYSSEDILKCLGYQRIDFRTIKERRGSIAPYIDNLKVRYWNSTAILRLKETLKACDEDIWQKMLKVMEVSKKESVFLLKEDEVLSNPVITKLQDRLLEEHTKNLELKIDVKVQEALNSSLQKKLDTPYKVIYIKGKGGSCKEKYTTLSNLTADLNTLLKTDKKVSIVNISPC